MKTFSLKKKIIIGIIGFLLIGIIGYVCFVLYALSKAFADSYSKVYTPTEVPSDTFLLAVTNPKGELVFIDYHTYQQNKTSSKPSYKLFEGKEGYNDCGLKIICDIKKDGDTFRVNQRGLFNEGLTTTYKVSANQIIPISMTCSTSKCSVGKKYPQEKP